MAFYNIIRIATDLSSALIALFGLNKTGRVLLCWFLLWLKWAGSPVMPTEHGIQHHATVDQDHLLQNIWRRRTRIDRSNCFALIYIGLLEFMQWWYCFL